MIKNIYYLGLVMQYLLNPIIDKNLLLHMVGIHNNNLLMTILHYIQEMYLHLKLHIEDHNQHLKHKYMNLFINITVLK
jgi:hypothetical protein